MATFTLSLTAESLQAMDSLAQGRGALPTFQEPGLRANLIRSHTDGDMNVIVPDPHLVIYDEEGGRVAILSLGKYPERGGVAGRCRTGRDSVAVDEDGAPVASAIDTHVDGFSEQELTSFVPKILRFFEAQ